MIKESLRINKSGMSSLSKKTAGTRRQSVSIPANTSHSTKKLLPRKSQTAGKTNFAQQQLDVNLMNHIV